MLEVQYRTVPPYSVAALWAVLISWLAWKYRVHGFLIAGSSVLSVIGYSIFLGTGVSPQPFSQPSCPIQIRAEPSRTHFERTLYFFLTPPSTRFELSTDFPTLSRQNTKALYGASFLTFSGALPNGPLFLSLAAANAGSPTERAIAAAIVPSFGSMGSIASTWLYLPAFKPRYIPVSLSHFFDSSHNALRHSTTRLRHSRCSPLEVFAIRLFVIFSSHRLHRGEKPKF